MHHRKCYIVLYCLLTFSQTTLRKIYMLVQYGLMYINVSIITFVRLYNFTEKRFGKDSSNMKVYSQISPQQWTKNPALECTKYVLIDDLFFHCIISGNFLDSSFFKSFLFFVCVEFCRFYLILRRVGCNNPVICKMRIYRPEWYLVERVG